MRTDSLRSTLTTLILLSSFHSANAQSNQSQTDTEQRLAEAIKRCEGVDKRTTFSKYEVAEDVAAFDLNIDRSIDEVEYRHYLGACDRLVKVMTGQKKEDAILDAIDDLSQAADSTCSTNEDGCDPFPASLFPVQDFSVERDRDLFKPAAMEKVGPSLKMDRSILDNVNPMLKGAATKGPFIVSYRRDYEKKEDAGLLLGTISYGPWIYSKQKLSSWFGSANATLDVNTGKKREDSSAAFGATASYWKQFADLDSGFGVSISPEYGTDGNGDRDVVTLKMQLTAQGERFLGAGQWSDLGNGHLTWNPALSLYCGEVRDAGGNAALALIAEQGSYCRAQPGAEVLWVTNRMVSPQLGIRLSYYQTYDLQDSWDRGYGELEATWGIKDAPLQMILLYRKGRKAPTFDKEDALIIGVGVRL